MFLKFQQREQILVKALPKRVALLLNAVLERSGDSYKEVKYTLRDLEWRFKSHTTSVAATRDAVALGYVEVSKSHGNWYLFTEKFVKEFGESLGLTNMLNSLKNKVKNIAERIEGYVSGLTRVDAKEPDIQEVYERHKPFLVKAHKIDKEQVDNVLSAWAKKYSISDKILDYYSDYVKFMQSYPVARGERRWAGACINTWVKYISFDDSKKTLEAIEYLHPKSNSYFTVFIKDREYMKLLERMDRKNESERQKNMMAVNFTKKRWPKGDDKWYLSKEPDDSGYYDIMNLELNRLVGRTNNPKGGHPAILWESGMNDLYGSYDKFCLWNKPKE